MYLVQPNGSLKKTRLKRGDYLQWIPEKSTVFAFKSIGEQIHWSESKDGAYLPQIESLNAFTDFVIAIANALGLRYKVAKGFGNNTFRLL
jgi:hypothetical protein